MNFPTNRRTNCSINVNRIAVSFFPTHCMNSIEKTKYWSVIVSFWRHFFQQRHAFYSIIDCFFFPSTLDRDRQKIEKKRRGALLPHRREFKLHANATPKSHVPAKCLLGVKMPPRHNIWASTCDQIQLYCHEVWK